jgi:hypothetical protein
MYAKGQAHVLTQLISKKYFNSYARTSPDLVKELTDGIRRLRGLIEKKNYC